MKRYIPLFALLALVLSACTIRLDVGLTVNENETGTFSLFMGFDQEMQDLIAQGGGGDFDLTEDLSDVPEGWTAVEVSEDGFDGVRIATDYDSFEDLEAKLAELGDGTDGVGTDLLSDFGLSRDGDEFRFEVDASGVDEGLSGALGESGGEDLLEGVDPSVILGDLFEVRFNLTMPGSITEHNADSVNGNTLTWELEFAEEGQTLMAVSTVGGGSSALLIAGIAVAAVAVIGAGVAIARRRKGDAAVEAVTSAPTNPI
ncbi:MAG: hypothetical protein QNJ81_04620 [Acidimicrobiia bacterium]|nr:hypothetical protein [Acidimicrobiia bacterium]